MDLLGNLTAALHLTNLETFTLILSQTFLHSLSSTLRAATMSQHQLPAPLSLFTIYLQQVPSPHKNIFSN